MDFFRTRLVHVVILQLDLRQTKSLVNKVWPDDLWWV